MIDEIVELARVGKWVISGLERSQRRMLIFAVSLMLIAACLTNLPAVLIGHLIDKMLQPGGRTLTAAMPTISFVLGAIVIRELLNVLRKYVVENTCTRVYKSKSVAAVEHLLRVDILSALIEQRSGSLQGRMYRSIDGYVKLIKLTFLDLLPAVFTGGCALYLVAGRNLWLACLMICVLPGGIFLTFSQMKTQRGIRIELLRAKEDIDGRIVEMLGGIEFIRAANTGPMEVERIDSSFERLRIREICHHLSMAWFDAGKYWNEGVFYILVLVFSLWLAVGGHASIGDVLTYTVLFGSVVSPLREVHRILDEAHESTIRVKDLMDLMSWPQDRSFDFHMAIKVTPMSEATEPAVVFENVDFRYDHADGPPSGLRKFNARIGRGETVGIVGKSGEGKSTVLRLLLRLVTPQNGNISIFGEDIASLSREKIARLFTFVPQTPYLFQGSVYENITYGCDDASLDAVIQASRCAQIHDEIVAFSGAYNHMISERGANLSGGQRQRIALARALLRNTPILILDEATSALDALNESKVQHAINNFGLERTIIIVAHRLSTLMAADRILVLSEGHVVEEGPFNSLLQAHGAFADLARLSSAVGHLPVSPRLQQEDDNSLEELHLAKNDR